MAEQKFDNIELEKLKNSFSGNSKLRLAIVLLTIIQQLIMEEAYVIQTAAQP